MAPTARRTGAGKALLSQSNPYAPPTDDAEPPPSSDGERGFVLAGRGRRFAGSIIDGSVAVVIVFPLYIAMRGSGLVLGPVPLGDPRFAAVVGILAGHAIQAACIARSGQSIGKMVLRMRIVDLRGRTAGLYRGFVLRTVPLALIGIVASLLGLVLHTDDVLKLGSVSRWIPLLDACFIFSGTENRTLHDFIAGTRVYRVGEPQAAVDEPRARKKRKRTAEVSTAP